MIDHRPIKRYVEVTAMYKSKERPTNDILKHRRYPVSTFHELEFVKTEPPFSPEVVKDLREKGNATRDMRDQDGNGMWFVFKLIEQRLGPKPT